MKAKKTSIRSQKHDLPMHWLELLCSTGLLLRQKRQHEPNHPDFLPSTQLNESNKFLANISDVRKIYMNGTELFGEMDCHLAI
ncbi:hypothetical protein BpHYR1_032427 [Brachionus plicatilis]|uniref:Uncharacterized protein n=1 Tax=Brachionus plicatilis TaxID=10195 RepID=A0A3M7T2M6_BRAPC|nr:hypothetical protein BpHYR1_032427 [Brachionus plicatilis]